MANRYLKHTNLICAALICAVAFCGCSRKTHRPYYNSSATDASDEAPISARGSDEALVSSCVFVTTAVFALWAASGKDSQLSSYAIKHTPIYGSKDRAKKASDLLQYVAVGITALIYAVKHFPVDGSFIDYPLTANSHPDNGSQYILGAGNYLMGGNYYAGYQLGINAPGRPLTALDEGEALIISTVATSTVVTTLKRYASRPRPDRSNSLSYPSGHTATVVCANHASAKMISGLGLPPYCSYPAYAALSLLTAATAWGRVEGGKHYPGDILAGMYVGTAFTDAPFALYQGEYQPLGVKFGVSTTNERAVTTTLLSTTINF